VKTVRERPLPKVLFENAWRMLRGPAMLTEYQFHRPRLWRFDYAEPQARVAIEIEGGTFITGRHVRGRAYSGDCTKYNQAALDGWTVFRLTTDMVEEAPVQNLTPIIQFIEQRRKGLVKQ